LEAIPSTHTIEEIELIFKNLKGKHREIVIHSLDDSLDVKGE
jgi:hypothetical protein